MNVQDYTNDLLAAASCDRGESLCMSLQPARQRQSGGSVSCSWTHVQAGEGSTVAAKLLFAVELQESRAK